MLFLMGGGGVDEVECSKKVCCENDLDTAKFAPVYVCLSQVLLPFKCNKITFLSSVKVVAMNKGRPKVLSESSDGAENSNQ